MARELPINQIIHGDCLEVMKDWPDKCVDLVLTDPPYPKVFDHVWDYLGEPTCRVSKDNSFQVSLCGHYQVPRVLDAVRAGGWEWFWSCIAPNNNQPIMFGYRVKCCHKPILMFKKGKALPNRIFCDNYGLRQKTSDWKNSQDLHKWGQAISLFYEPIDSLTKPGDTILDPFVGSGTVCEAAKRLGRNYIGIDISEEYCEIARLRLKAVDVGVSAKELKQGQIPLFGGDKTVLHVTVSDPADRPVKQQSNGSQVQSQLNNEPPPF